jgi:hypothetical protein
MPHSASTTNLSVSIAAPPGESLIATQRCAEKKLE